MRRLTSGEVRSLIEIVGAHLRTIHHVPSSIMKYISVADLDEVCERMRATFTQTPDKSSLIVLTCNEVAQDIVQSVGLIAYMELVHKELIEAINYVIAREVVRKHKRQEEAVRKELESRNAEEPT